jgi:hypothetical protein
MTDPKVKRLQILEIKICEKIYPEIKEKSNKMHWHIAQ